MLYTCTLLCKGTANQSRSSKTLSNLYKGVSSIYPIIQMYQSGSTYILPHEKVIYVQYTCRYIYSLEPYIQLSSSRQSSLVTRENLGSVEGEIRMHNEITCRTRLYIHAGPFSMEYIRKNIGRYLYAIEHFYDTTLCCHSSSVHNHRVLYISLFT